MSAKFGRLLFKNLANSFSPSETTLTAGDLSFVVCLQEAFPKTVKLLNIPDSSINIIVAITRTQQAGNDTMGDLP